jgi:hypothetical protein
MTGISDEDRTDIIRYLNGKLEEDSERALKARTTLAHAVREGFLCEKLAFRLAGLIDPKLDDVIELRLVLERRRPRGRPKAQYWEVAEIVERRIECGDKKEAAYQYAVEKLGVSKRTAEKSHAKCKKQLRAIRWLGPHAKVITRLD